MEKYDVTVGEFAPGVVRFYKKGTEELHRLDGPAVELADGDKIWYQNNKRHRLDGPAIECANGAKYWHQNGKCHSLDGPAIEYADGTKCWFIEGKEYTETQFKERTAPVKELTVAEIEKLLGHRVKVVG